MNFERALVLLFAAGVVVGTVVTGLLIAWSPTC